MVGSASAPWHLLLEGGPLVEGMGCPTFCKNLCQHCSKGESWWSRRLTMRAVSVMKAQPCSTPE